MDNLRVLSPEGTLQIQLAIESDKRADTFNGRRPRIISQGMAGAYVFSKPMREINSNIAIDSTLRMAALHSRLRDGGVSFNVRRDDLQEKVRFRKAGASIIFLVDASGSMKTRKRIKEAKAAALGLLYEAYIQRDRVGLITFRGSRADLILPPTGSVTQARHLLYDIPCGGKTPVSAGLSLALQTMLLERERDRHRFLLLVILSDGKANQAVFNDPVKEALNVALHIARLRIKSVFLDTDEDWHEPGMGRKLSRYMNGQYFSLGQVKAGRIIKIIKDVCIR